MKNLVLVRDLFETYGYYEEFLHLFAIMQSVTVEASNPMLEFPSFSASVHYFGALFEAPELMPGWREEDGEILTTVADVDDDAVTDLVGFIYLYSSQEGSALPYHHGPELSIGVVIKPEFQGLGYARLAVNHVVDVAFRDAVCHRIQALVIESKENPRAVSLFFKCGFSLEGTRRQTFFGPYDNTWKDVTCLSILDTDYVARKSYGDEDATVSLWESMLHRQEQEREQLSGILQCSQAAQTVAPVPSLQHEINNAIAADNSTTRGSPAPGYEHPVVVTLDPPVSPSSSVSIESKHHQMSQTSGDFPSQQNNSLREYTLIDNHVASSIPGSSDEDPEDDSWDVITDSEGKSDV